MKAYIFLFVSVVISLISCDKNKIKIDSQIKKEIILNGKFSNIKEYQFFDIYYSQDLLALGQNYVDHANLKMIKEDSIFQFNHIGDGMYKSNIKFKGIAGKDYEINLTHKGIKSSVKTKMPHTLAVNNFTLSVEDNSSTLLLLEIDINSPVNQYFGYNLFISDSLGVLNDTIWEEKEIELTNIYQVNAGINAKIQLRDINLFLNDLDHATIRLEIYTLSNDVAKYLIDLKDFLHTQSTSNQSINPPFFFSNDHYGLAFGTSISTITKSF